jgi:hypothetical protein
MKWGIFMDEWGDFGAVVHEMVWFYGEGTRSEEGRRVEIGRQNVAQREREMGVGLRGKIFENVE